MTDQKLLTICGIFTLGTALLLLNAGGIILLWTWFVTPVFGMPVPTLARVFGLDIMLTFLIYHQTTSDKSLAVQLSELLISKYGYLLILAWVVHFFV